MQWPYDFIWVSIFIVLIVAVVGGVIMITNNYEREQLESLEWITATIETETMREGKIPPRSIPRRWAEEVVCNVNDGFFGKGKAETLMIQAKLEVGKTYQFQLVGPSARLLLRNIITFEEVIIP